MITGTALIRSLEGEADSQVRTASLIKESTVDQLVQRITGALDFQMSSIQRVDLIRALRTKSFLDNKQRAEALPWLPEQVVTELQSELSALERISAEVHQARTQAAYISGVMRPFDPKYSYRWLSELPEGDRQVLRVRIENLERSEIKSFDELMDWALDVVELFKEVVVAEEVSTDLHTKRVSGSIAFKSSRTYIQAWLAFIKKNAQMLIGGQDVELDQDITSGFSSSSSVQKDTRNSELSAPRASSSNSNLADENRSKDSNSEGYTKEEVDDFMDEALVEFRRLQNENLELKRSLASKDSLDDSSKSSSEIQASSSETIPGLTIWAQSEGGATASCSFMSAESAKKGIAVWLDSLGAIWLGGSSQVKFEVQIKLPDSKLQFSLPTLSLGEATTRLIALSDQLKAMD